ASVDLERDGSAVHERLRRIAASLDLEDAAVLGVALVERQPPAADEIRARLRRGKRCVAAGEARAEQRAANGCAGHPHSSATLSVGRMTRPDGNLASRIHSLRAPSRPRLPSSTTRSPTLIKSRVQPTRVSALTLRVCVSQTSSFPSSPTTETKYRACGFT